MAVDARNREMRERAFINFMIQEDKHENVVRQQQADEERNRRRYKIIELENQNFNKIQQEKATMMEQRKLFGLQIAADKQEIMQDIEMMKIGKVEPGLGKKNCNLQIVDFR